MLDCFVTAVHLRSGRVCCGAQAAPFKKKRPLKHGFVSVGRQAAYPVQGMRAAYHAPGSARRDGRGRQRAARVTRLKVSSDLLPFCRHVLRVTFLGRLRPEVTS
ncbi:hypothetical protein GCM10008960_00900 [Deinococcus sedimenti]|uniref:Transposase n=1 Tax=Deinococcus sedimenti TaxID=1867090 RepID=A0ABQ2RXE9_9DEIO|nr:hypothetical protein GCM10008960_00900 [Deinococcus sedimenti]